MLRRLLDHSLTSLVISHNDLTRSTSYKTTKLTKQAVKKSARRLRN